MVWNGQVRDCAGLLGEDPLRDLEAALPRMGSREIRHVRSRRAPCKGGAFQWVKAPPGQSLQPEATGAVMEVTKWLKPSDSGSHLGDRRECAGRNASERRANLEKDNVRADPAVVPGKADTDGRLSEDHAPPPHRGSGGIMYTWKARATREAPWRGRGRPTGRP